MNFKDMSRLARTCSQLTFIQDIIKERMTKNMDNLEKFPWWWVMNFDRRYGHATYNELYRSVTRENLSLQIIKELVHGCVRSNERKASKYLRTHRFKVLKMLHEKIKKLQDRVLDNFDYTRCKMQYGTDTRRDRLEIIPTDKFEILEDCYNRIPTGIVVSFDVRVGQLPNTIDGLGDHGHMTVAWYGLNNGALNYPMRTRNYGCVIVENPRYDTQIWISSTIAVTGILFQYNMIY